jgi:proteic killer suppression protein
MEIVYANNAIRKRCQRAAGKLRQRLDDIRAAESMAVLQTLPGQYHPLSANRAGEWSCHLEEPYRLVFRPIEDPAGTSTAVDRDRDRATAVSLIEVVNYHERKNRK